jgi:hypothetical protein
VSHVLKWVEKIEVKAKAKVQSQIEQHYEFLSKTHMLDASHTSEYLDPLLQHLKDVTYRIYNK